MSVSSVANPGQNERIDRLEGERDRIITLLGKDIASLGDKGIALFEKTITNGVNIELKKQALELQRQSDAGEDAFRQASIHFINQQGERNRKIAQQIREGELAGGTAALPAVETKGITAGEGLIGQFQVGVKVLNGTEAFDPVKATPPPPREEDLPDIP